MHKTSYSDLIETTMRLSRTFFEILSLIFPKLKTTPDSDYAPFRDNLSSEFRRLGLAMINMHTEFEISSLSRSRDILRELKVQNGLRDVATHISGIFCHP